MKYSNVKLDPEALLRLRVFDTYRRMESEEGKVDARRFCKLMGISKSWFYKWKGRYNPGNLNTLKSHSRKPKTFKTIPWKVVVEICEWKRANPRKSHYYLYQTWLKEGRFPPCSPKTIYNWWKKRRLIITRHKRKRRKTKLFNQAKVPGELVQVDVKHLPRRKYQYTAIDVVSRWRFALGYKAFNMQNSIDFANKLVSEAKTKGIKIKLVQTDNGPEFQSEFKRHLEETMKLSHQYTWIHTPDQNGKVERSHRTDEEEFYQETEIDYTSLEDINIKLTNWILYYNTQRLHFALNFDTPEECLTKWKVSTI